MFSIGLEFSLRKLARLPRAGLVGLIDISAMLWFGYATGRALGWPNQRCFFAGGMVAIEHDDHRQGSPSAPSRGASDLVFGVLIIEDLAAILMLAILTAVAGGEGRRRVLATTAGRLGAFLFVLTVGGYLSCPA
jgi:CPA2 family monovalent cation:H+ antiporter-2